MASSSSRSREDSRVRRRSDSRPREGRRRGGSTARRRYEKRPRSRQRARQRRRTSSSSRSVSKSPVRHASPPRKVSRSAGFDQNATMPEDLAVKAALQRMTVEQPPPQPLIQPPVNPIVERFLALNPVDPRAADRLRMLAPEQQAHVVTHSLAGARDPTAVLIGRIRKVVGWVQPDSFPGRPIYSSPPNAPPPYMTMKPVQQTPQQKAVVAQTTQLAAREVEQNLRSTDARHAESQRSHHQVRDGDSTNADEQLREKMESSLSGISDNPAWDAADPLGLEALKEPVSKGSTIVPSVPYQRPFASKPRMTAAAEKPENSAPPREDPSIAKQLESYNKAQDLLQVAISQSSSRAAAHESAPLEPSLSGPCPGAAALEPAAPLEPSPAARSEPISAEASAAPQSVSFVSLASGFDSNFLEPITPGPVEGIDSDWLRMSRALNGQVVCDSKIPKGLQALKEKAVLQSGPAATIADLAGKKDATVALPSGLLDALLVQHQQQQQQLEKTQPNLAALLAQPQSQPSSGMPASSQEVSLSESEKAYQRAWLEHQMQAQMFLFEQQQALGLSLGPDSRNADAPTKGKGKGKRSNQAMLPGDWECPKCGDHQFSRNWTCRHCGALRPD